MQLWRFVSSVWLGVGLMIALAVLYGVVSILEQFLPSKTMLPPTSSIYAHWTVLTLTAMFCLNLLFATVRIPVKLDRAGAWCSHLGLMFLVVGSVAFWRTRTEGQCFIPRDRDDRWPVMRHFFRSTDEVACHVSNREMITPGSGVETAFDSPGVAETVDVDVPIKGAPAGVSLKVTKIYPRAELTEHWFDDAGWIEPAVEVEVSHGDQVGQVTMCRAYRDTRQFGLPHCILRFQNSEPASQAEIDRINAETPATSQPSSELFTIHYTGSGPVVLVVSDSAGKMSRRTLAPGQSVSTSSPGHPTRIKLVGVKRRARRGWNIEVPPESMAGRFSAALKLQVTDGKMKFDTIVPYQAYMSGQPTSIGLASGREFFVLFSHRSEELPESIVITRHEFKTAPASRMPEDYICDINIGDGIHTRKRTLKLNFPITVGRYHLHQSTWQPKDGTQSNYNDPSAIVLGVADRPGITLIALGSVMICIGFPYAFYIKPLIFKAVTRRAQS